MPAPPITCSPSARRAARMHGEWEQRHSVSPPPPETRLHAPAPRSSRLASCVVLTKEMDGLTALVPASPTRT